MSLLARVSRRLYRGLTRLYPPEFREEWGGDLLAFFDDCLEAERARGGAWLWRIWVSTLADLAASVPRERRDARFLPIPLDHRPGGPMGTLAQDLRYAWRALRG